MMRKIIILLINLGLFLSPALALSITIDGDLSDWGIDSADLDNGLNHDSEIAWIPDSPTADWIVENDLDEAYEKTWEEETSGWNFKEHGVHIMGEGATYIDYDEPLLIDTRCGTMWWCSNPGGVPQPSGGERYDVEALYLDDDERYIYFGILLTDNLGALGDLAITVNGVNYGIVIIAHDGLANGSVYKNPVWLTSTWAEKSDGSDIITRIDHNNPGTIVGTADIAIEDAGVSDNGKDNKIIEIKVEKTILGSPSTGDKSDIGYTLTCGNDYIGREMTYDYNTIPEFSTIAIPAIMLFVIYMFRRK
jgi:hypothetical protein